MYDTYAYFWVSDFEGSPETISHELSVLPTECWMKGDSWYPGRPRPSSDWHLCSQLPRSEMFMENHIEAVLELIEPRAAVIATLRHRYPMGINCVGYYHGEHPGFHLSSALIARLHALSLDLDFDLYCCNAEDEPATQNESE